MDLGEKIETGRFSIIRGEKFVGLHGEMIAFLHVIKCRLDLLGEITSRVRIEGRVVRLIIEMFHGFIDVLLAVHDYDG